jgi:hypothetical protein
VERWSGQGSTPQLANHVGALLDKGGDQLEVGEGDSLYEEKKSIKIKKNICF